MTHTRARVLIGFMIVAVAVAVVGLGRRVPLLSSDVPAYRQLGPSRAKVQIMEYSDFQCPRCAAAHPVLQALRERHVNDVRLVFRHMPLHQHKWAVDAARAAEAAGKQGKFWEYADRLYGEQAVWAAAPDAVPLFRDYAKALGLSLEQFDRDVASDAVKEIVTKERALADAVPVGATPTFLINDRMLVGDSQLAGLGERFVREELSK